MAKIKFNFDLMSHRALTKIGYIFVKQARDNMQTVSHGRTYMIRGKPHIASKRGDTANNQTGMLTSTIRYDIRGKNMVFGAGDSGTNYAKYLEGGMDRPNIVKSVLQNEDKAAKIISKLFADSLKSR